MIVKCSIFLISEILTYLPNFIQNFKVVEQDLRNRQKRRQKDEENGDTGQKGQMQDMYIDKDRAIGKICLMYMK